jgi:lipopolysaccharide export system protein LptA
MPVPLLAEKGDREKPVLVEADRVTVDELKGVSTYEGNVQLAQGTMLLRAASIVVEQDEQGLKSGLAVGDPVTFRQKRDGEDVFVEAYASRVEYDARAEKLTLSGDARVKQGEDEIRGDQIVYHLATERFQAAGSGKPGTSGQVRAVIKPKEKGKSTAPGMPLPLAPSLNTK